MTNDAGRKPDHLSPWTGRRMFGRGTGRSYPPANRCFPPSRGGLSQVMGTIAVCWRSREPHRVRWVKRETGLLAPHRVGRTAAKPRPRARGRR